MSKKLYPGRGFRPQMNQLILLAALPVLWLGGCQFPFEFRSREEMEKEVLDKDPAFSEVIDKRAILDEEIKILRTEFEDKKKSINKTISDLKEELNSARKDITDKIRRINAQLDPYREELRLKVKELTAELKLKESSFQATTKTVAKLTRLAREEQPSEELAKERPEWQDKTASLKTQAQELGKDISYLRDKIRINRLKLKLLR